MAWVWLVTAGLFEILFASFLKLSDGFTKLGFTIAFVVSAAFSFYFLTKAMQEIPVGTAYAVWTGIGAAGVAIFGIIFFAEALSFARLFFISTLILSIIGLKVVSS
ncbi:MAG: multidrug efflux SMR transporter [Sulfurimonas sp.]|nr:multidrug efflux SMR transporter [Sulfurimonas sp.]MDD3834204.1 multidrug efflux SMR transporter [Sulfurimonas sp.]